jgi:hypothetical protein
LLSPKECATGAIWKEPTNTFEKPAQLDRARAANHYDMAGHGAKAEEHLRAAEHELHEAIEAIRAER